MAQQLLRERTAPAYRGVEAYARAHSAEDAGSLAWFVAGYAHMLDHEPAKALDSLRRARAHAGDLADYVTYYLASASQQTGDSAQAEALLKNFEETYPDSILLRDAHVTRASALISTGHAEDAVNLLEHDRQPTRADVELVLGRAYMATNQVPKGIAALRTVYYTMPLVPESDEAEKALNALGAQAPPAAFADRRTRADLLAKGRRASDAANEYRMLLGDASAEDRPGISVALGSALRSSGQQRDAKSLLESLQGVTGDPNAQRWYLLGELARSGDDEPGVQSALNQLRQVGPTSPWLEQALLSAANMYFLRRDLDQASKLYHELAERFPTSPKASYAHWKSSWILWRQGQGAEARSEFEKQIQYFPEGGETPAALYWRGRAAEEDNDPGRARAYYEKLSRRYLNYYYAILGRERIKGLASVDTKPDPIPGNIPALPPKPTIQDTETPADNLRVQKARLLVNGALLDFAIRELQAAAADEPGGWQVAEMARLCADAGRYDRAIDVMKRAVPNYFALQLPELPQAYWDALFPKAYWADLKKYASENGLDPYLVAALIRQESAFNPNAISRANAIGLMQLLPSTGRKVARELKIRGFGPASLTISATNLRLGTRYFRAMVDQFGSVEYALAAYNAGADRVQEWMAAAKYRDTAEFVESIPFTETREYVQAIMRNAGLYRQLYGAP